MSANAVIQARVNESIKIEAGVVLAAIGLTVSDAVRLMLIRIVQDGALPFDPIVPNKKTIAAMREAETGKLKRCATVKDLMADLNDEND